MFDGIICIHGFAGSPKDFRFLIEALPKNGVELPIHTLDLYNDPELEPSHSIKDWVKSAKSSLPAFERPLWIGYSLGGRLALNVLASEPDGSESHVLALSSRPGIWEEQARQSRHKFDTHWAQRFQNEELEKVFRDWSDLPVFAGSQSQSAPISLQADLLAKCFLNWSPRQHIFGFEDLMKKKSRIHWCFGERDESYQSVFQDLQGKGFASCELIHGAGHRLLKDTPIQVSEKVLSIIESTTRGSNL